MQIIIQYLGSQIESPSNDLILALDYYSKKSEMQSF